ncbi:MAG: rhodanese-like domain-containing protein [Luteolibacter sp.]|jgi:rhodanese-related sulfurtransferase|nr:rhodanese-like domain-containing protein [Luteolibacter sp.]
MSHFTISAVEAAAAIKSGLGILLDVRTPAEFEEIHAEGAVLVPLDILDRKRVEDARGADAGPVYILCASGIRSVKAAAQLESAGLGDLHVVEGGTKAWDAAGLPVLRGRKTISIERQVRIGAGLLVLTGVSLGWFYHPGFFLLSAFVGAGLVFAGITDICGMAIFLAKAPWNRSGKEFRTAGS